MHINVLSGDVTPVLFWLCSGVCAKSQTPAAPPTLREISLGSIDSAVAETYNNTTVPGSDEGIGISVFLFIYLCSGRLVGTTCHNGFCVVLI